MQAREQGREQVAAAGAARMQLTSRFSAHLSLEPATTRKQGSSIREVCCPAAHPAHMQMSGNDIPPEYYGAIEKGFKEAANSGALIGAPVEVCGFREEVALLRRGAHVCVVVLHAALWLDGEAVLCCKRPYGCCQLLKCRRPCRCTAIDVQRQDLPVGDI